jgi:hypothetical protein
VQRLAPYNDRLEWIPDAVSEADSLLQNHAIDFIMSTSPPVATHLVAWALKRRHDVTWIADFRDPIVGNPFRRHPLGTFYDQWIERAIVRSADAVIVNTDSALEQFVRRYPSLRDKFCLIWNGYDPDEELVPLPIPRRPHRVLTHLGSIYGGRHPGILLDALDRLSRAERIDLDALRLRLVGTIDHSEAWVGSPAARYLQGRSCLEWTNATIPRAAARVEMATADYLLLLDLNERAVGVQVPAKLFEYVRIGRPILALTSRNSPVERILSRSEVPHACLYQNDSAEELDRKVVAFLSMEAAPRAPSEWFHRHFNAAGQTQQLVDTFLSVRRSAAP